MILILETKMFRKSSLILGALVVAAGFMVSFSGKVVLANHEGVSHIDAGKAVYETTCVACHGANGKGTIPGVPDFNKKKSPLVKSDEELFANIKNGFQSPGSYMAMPVLGGNLDLTDQEVRYVIEYLRAEFAKK